MRALLVIALVALVASAASGRSISAFDSWEGTYTVLGMYGTGEPPIIEEIAIGAPPEPVHGAQTLKLTDNSPTGTPQVYVAWVKNLSAGDTVSVSLWRYDTTPDAAPSCRLWGHWNDDPNDINGYSGSAGGQDDYGPGTGWDQMYWEWTADLYSGLVVEVRTYSSAGDVVWVDAMTVNVYGDGDEEIITPETTPVESRTWSSVKALFR